MTSTRPSALPLTVQSEKTIALPPRRCGSRTLAVAVGVLMVGLLGGCGSSSRYLNGTKVESSIAQSFLSQRHVYTRVLCPPKIVQHKGDSFQCRALFDVGSYRIPVTQVAADGKVRWNTRAPVALLDITHVTSAIRHSVLKQRSVRSSVVCPAQVLQQKGLGFTCTALVRIGTAKVKPGRYRFTVTQVDGAGHVSYVAG